MSVENPDKLIPLKWSKNYEGKQSLLAGTPVNCILTEGGVKPAQTPSGITVLTKEDLKSQVTLIADPRWPSVQGGGGRGSGGGASAGPTGMPWVDTNGWMIRLAQAQQPGKPVWVDCAPPEDAGAGSYRLAVADAGAFGARWVVSPGASFPAEQEWKGIVSAIEFFEKHSDWKAFEPVASLGVLSDFEGPNEFMGTEALNLIARRQICYRVLIKSRTRSLAGLAGVVYVDEKPPAGATLEMLSGFVKAGGVLLAPPGTSIGSPSTEQYPEYKLFTLGKGKVAVPNEAWSDPYVLAQDAHMLLSRRHDKLRLFNFGAMNSHYVRSQDGKRAVVHLLNYSRRQAAHEVTLAVSDKYRSGRFFTFDSVAPLKPSPAARGVEFALPPFDVYAAIEMEI